MARTIVSKAGAKSTYPNWFYLPSVAMYVVIFAIPTFASFYFSLTRWTLTEADFIGFRNYVQFFTEPRFLRSFANTFIYGFVEAGLLVVLGLLLAVLLTSRVLARGFLRSVLFFPVLVSTIGVGVTFKVLMDPFGGAINEGLAMLGIEGPGWLTDPNLALFSVILIGVWKGLGVSTLIFIAGLVAIPNEYFEAAKADGASGLQIFWHITLPLIMPATATVTLLSLINGLRSFALIWATTEGGPGFSSDVISSSIYKEYEAGFYGLSTAGNVILFVVVLAIVLPVQRAMNRRSIDA